MIEANDKEVSTADRWIGIERRNGRERRRSTDRRAVSRTTWQRRSGQDRRGHKLYFRPRFAAD
jgi:hypothetical protein